MTNEPGGRAPGEHEGDHEREGGEEAQGAAREPAVNAPAVIWALLAVFALLQLAQDRLPPRMADELVLSLGFMPLRYAMPLEMAARLPGGAWALFTSPFSHMLLHAGWGHLVMNALWLLAFGAPVARRVGAGRFLALSLLSAGGGAALFLPFHWGEQTLLVGASGAISGLMGAAIRLIFAGNASLTRGMRRDLSRVRPLSVVESFLYPRPRAFILIWMGVNLAFGLLGIGAGAQTQAIAWEAHTGGFLTGLLLLGLLDRPRR